MLAGAARASDSGGTHRLRVLSRRTSPAAGPISSAALDLWISELLQGAADRPVGAVFVLIRWVGKDRA
jgi:hypothetical protein